MSKSHYEMTVLNVAVNNEQAKRCPLCGNDNGCAVLAGKPVEACWCGTAGFPREIFELIPPEERRKACICSECLRAFKEKRA